MKEKYIAIKVKYFNYWIWFEVEKIEMGGGQFVGKDGWGDNGALTSIEVAENQIEGRIYSNQPQYR